MISTIIFDFDGTIVEDLGVFVDCYNQAAKSLKIEELSEKKVKELKNVSAKELIKDFKPKWKLPILIYFLKRNLKRRSSELTVKEEMIDTIFELKKHYNIGILSSNNKKLIDTFLKFNHLNVFDFVISEKNLFGKDKALKKIIKKLKISNQEVIYIGDEAKDIDACKKAGIQIISVTWGFNSSKILKNKNSKNIVSKPKDILKLIDLKQKEIFNQ